MVDAGASFPRVPPQERLHEEKTENGFLFSQQ